MSDNSKIQWCDASLNFATGCTKISLGCENCYALDRVVPMMQRIGNKKYAKGAEFAVHEDVMFEPLKWKKPKKIFVNSVSDTFHPQMPYRVLDIFFGAVVKNCPHHTFMLLTKRPGIMQAYFSTRPDYLFPNVWIGVTAETQRTAIQRLSLLEKIPAKIRFVSVEPMLTAVDLSAYAEWLDWVIIGCESGKERRHIDTEFIQGLVLQCKQMGIPVFLKQMEFKGKVISKPAISLPVDPYKYEARQYLEFPER